MPGRIRTYVPWEFYMYLIFFFSQKKIVHALTWIDYVFQKWNRRPAKNELRVRLNLIFSLFFFFFFVDLFLF